MKLAVPPMIGFAHTRPTQKLARNGSKGRKIGECVRSSASQRHTLYLASLELHALCEFNNTKEAY